MGKVSIYLPDDLERRVKEKLQDRSAICQVALEQELEHVEKKRTRAQRVDHALNLIDRGIKLLEAEARDG